MSYRMIHRKSTTNGTHTKEPSSLRLHRDETGIMERTTLCFRHEVPIHDVRNRFLDHPLRNHSLFHPLHAKEKNSDETIKRERVPHPKE